MSSEAPEPPVVEVVFATPDRQVCVTLAMEAGDTAVAAVRRSGVIALLPGTVEAGLDLGVWGRPVEPDHRLAPGDRVEIYRPLEVDPREARRRRAARR